MRVATWNVNGLRARLDFVLHWLRARRPDVVGIQELKLEDEHFPTAELAAIGYQSVAFCQRGWNGVAILAQQPIEVVQTRPARPGRARRAPAHRAHRRPRVHDALHPQRQVRRSRGLPAQAGVARRAGGSPRGATHDPARPAVVCGDFNLCPQPIDSWNEALLHGAIFHTDEERSRFQRLLDWGLVDVYRRLRPDTRRSRGGTIAPATSTATKGCASTSCSPPSRSRRARSRPDIDREYRKKKDGLIASDHAPVMVDLAPDGAV